MVDDIMLLQSVYSCSQALLVIGLGLDAVELILVLRVGVVNALANLTYISAVII